MANNKEKIMKAEELKWLARDDADIMARYQEILNDKARFKYKLKEGVSSGTLNIENIKLSQLYYKYRNPLIKKKPN